MITDEKRWREEDRRTEALINRLDTFLEKMQVVADRLVAKLDETDETDEGEPDGAE
jgi:hypothetical protein